MVQTVGMLANTHRDTALHCARELLEQLRSNGVAVRLERSLAAALEDPAAADENAVGSADLLIAFGGDGTILAANRLASPHGTPVLGIHAGGPASFGFMTETTPDGARDAVSAVLEGRYRVDERLMVCGTITRDGAEVARFHALNELVIRAQSRMLKMRVTVNRTFIATYAADGIIVATPTGSTAYNLAAGGPLVQPTVQTILLTPICPHTLNVRSLLTGVEDAILVELTAESRDITHLTVDGQLATQLEPGDRIRFEKSEYRGRFVTVDGGSFYQKVQTRLRLGERFGN